MLMKQKMSIRIRLFTETKTQKRTRPIEDLLTGQRRELSLVGPTRGTPSHLARTDSTTERWIRFATQPYNDVAYYKP